MVSTGSGGKTVGVSGRQEFLVKRIVLLLAGSLFATTLALAGPDTVREPQACEEAGSDCASRCDEERLLGFLRTAASDRCAFRCERTREACQATRTDVDRFEVILGRNDVARRAEPAPEPVGKQRKAPDARSGR